MDTDEGSVVTRLKHVDSNYTVLNGADGYSVIIF